MLLTDISERTGLNRITSTETLKNMENKSIIYSALGASSAAGASVAGASSTAVSAAGAASALVDLRERRVDFFLVAVFAMFSSKSTSSMKHIWAASP